MVGDTYELELQRQANKKRYRPMDKAGLYARLQRDTGTTEFPELAELAPEVLKLDAATQHWFTDRTRAAYNAGKGGQQPPVRARDTEVANVVGPANFTSYFKKVFELGRTMREAERAATPRKALDNNLF